MMGVGKKQAKQTKQTKQTIWLNMISILNAFYYSMLEIVKSKEQTNQVFGLKANHYLFSVC